jgi:hypothetical protein
LIKLPDGGFTILSTNRLYSVNANGVILWSKEIPPAKGKRFEGASFVRTADGSYVIGGVFDREPFPHNAITLIKTDATVIASLATFAIPTISRPSLLW